MSCVEDRRFDTDTVRMYDQHQECDALSSSGDAFVVKDHLGTQARQDDLYDRVMFIHLDNEMTSARLTERVSVGRVLCQ